MATVDEIRAKYTCDDSGYVSQIESKWNNLISKAKKSLKPDPYMPRKKIIDTAIRQELQNLFERTKSEAEELKKLSNKMSFTDIAGYMVVR